MERAWQDAARAAVRRGGGGDAEAAAAARQVVADPEGWFAAAAAGLTHPELEELARYTGGDPALRRRVREVLCGRLPRGVRAGRRWAAMEQCQREGYFTLGEIKRRAPDMYQLYVGRYERTGMAPPPTGPPGATMAERVIACGDVIMTEMDAQAEAEGAHTATAGDAELRDIVASVKATCDGAAARQDRTAALLHGLCDAVQAANDSARGRAAERQAGRAGGTAAPPQLRTHLQDVALEMATMEVSEEAPAPAAPAGGASEPALFGTMDEGAEEEGLEAEGAAGRPEEGWQSSDDEWLDEMCGEPSMARRPDRAPPTEAEREDMLTQLIDAMKQQYLAGGDPGTDYTAIDLDDTLDDMREAARAEEDEYFGEAGDASLGYHALVERMRAAGQ